MDIGAPAARWVVKGCLAAFALVIVVLCRSPRDIRQGVRFAAECSLIVLGMLLFSERTWKHHAVTLLLPFAVLACCAFSGTRTWWWLLAIVAGLMNLAGFLPQHAADLAMVYGIYCSVFLLVMAGICGVLAPTRSVSRRVPS
jgi:hypothetical protein